MTVATKEDTLQKPVDGTLWRARRRLILVSAHSEYIEIGEVVMIVSTEKAGWMIHPRPDEIWDIVVLHKEKTERFNYAKPDEWYGFFEKVTT